MEGSHLVVVTPVYEDADSAHMLCKELGALFGKSVYVVAVDDGSIKAPLDPENLKAEGIQGVILSLRRNVGHQRAIAVGLHYVNDNISNVNGIVLMDSDGEDIPQHILHLLNLMNTLNVDAVVAQRQHRTEGFIFKMFYFFYRLLFRCLTGRSIRFGNFMALKPQALRRLTSMPEIAIHLAASMLASKLRLAFCPLDRGVRYAGRSRMTFLSLVLHGFKALMVFAEEVMVRMGTACSLIALLSFLASVAATLLKVFGFASPGWFSVALGLLFLIFLQTGALALLTLVLAGILKEGMLNAKFSYQELIGRVTEVHIHQKRAS